MEPNSIPNTENWNPDTYESQMKRLREKLLLIEKTTKAAIADCAQMNFNYSAYQELAAVLEYVESVTIQAASEETVSMLAVKEQHKIAN